jgi:hypothetical protein
MRLNMIHVISKLKLVSILLSCSELLQVAWIIYGLHVFYSEDNSCNWESKHSFGYVVMFMNLTLGFILIFKWFFKLLEILLILLNVLKV